MTCLSHLRNISLLFKTKILKYHGDVVWWGARMRLFCHKMSLVNDNSCLHSAHWLDNAIRHTDYRQLSHPPNSKCILKVLHLVLWLCPRFATTNNSLRRVMAPSTREQHSYYYMGCGCCFARRVAFCRTYPGWNKCSKTASFRVTERRTVNNLLKVVTRWKSVSARIWICDLPPRLIVS